MNGAWQLRRDLVDFAARTYQRGLVAATDGNLSVRLPANQLLVTPSGLCLGDLRPDDLCVVSLDGRFLNGPHKPTSELALHLEVYRQRSDVQAVVHAHPPTINAFSFAGHTLDPCVIPEAVVGLGRVPTTPYATPSSDEGPRAIRDLIRDNDALIMQRHGSLTVGRTIREAYFRTEKMEHAAEILLKARQLGPIVPMSDDEVARLGAIAESRGWCRADDIRRACGRGS